MRPCGLSNFLSHLLLLFLSFAYLLLSLFLSLFSSITTFDKCIQCSYDRSYSHSEYDVRVCVGYFIKSRLRNGSSLGGYDTAADCPCPYGFCSSGSLGLYDIDALHQR